MYPYQVPWGGAAYRRVGVVGRARLAGVLVGGGHDERSAGGGLSGDAGGADHA